MDEENTNVKNSDCQVSDLTIGWYYDEFLKQLAEFERGELE